MSSERDDFSLSGPLHLTVIDWTNIDHQRSVAASLVQGVYTLERDRQLKREGSQALAPPWWEFFHFRLLRQLVDDVDFCTFGAIYEYCPSASPRNDSTDRSPRYVVALRGTITKADSFSRDFDLDIQIIRNGLHQTSRFEIAMQAVRNTVASVGESNVWLAGHSLGAAMGMLAGKTMAKSGIYLESFLFNPPFLSPPIERIKAKKVKHGIRIAGSVITAGLALALNANQQRNRTADPFLSVAAWVPFLYVNPNDHLCSEYVGYFEHRKKMEEIGVGAIEKVATQHSLGGLVMSALGKDAPGEPIHLIPSANLTVNLTPVENFKQAHGIHQWWRDDQQLKSQFYKYQ
ncbi:GDSL esterase/lipase At4g10955-like [Carica papaya]|uniref:GDSL esterase/lipase At4g10955-like n=1 Tax=Carica papaya TaxID=3649 RepID=UPI000B8D000F|nr:GDSL esterase/lipase At4g10955-like [Carica papaya]XP_021894854.1 GDSL esterase/lipase At4g10955-like [Carica papaya]XP_021894855.1 GDSL esterase/lipase At4g10955-like [Carica papaya]